MTSRYLTKKELEDGEKMASTTLGKPIKRTQKDVDRFDSLVDLLKAQEGLPDPKEEEKIPRLLMQTKLLREKFPTIIKSLPLTLQTAEDKHLTDMGLLAHFYTSSYYGSKYQLIKNLKIVDLDKDAEDFKLDFQLLTQFYSGL